MLKSEINLLPPSVIKERTKRIYLQRAGRLYLVLMIGLGLMLLVYGGVGWMLWNLRNQLDGSQTDIAGGTQEVQAQVKAINGIVAGMERYSGDHMPWARQVQEALLVVPTGIVVRDVELKEASLPSGIREQFLELTGNSVSRSAVVEFEKSLSALPWVERVDSPLKNLASGESVSFSFSLRRSLMAKEEAL